MELVNVFHVTLWDPYKINSNYEGNSMYKK